MTTTFPPMPLCLDVARQFGRLITHQDYQRAWLLLTREARLVHPPAAMAAAVAAMTSYASSSIRESQVVEDATVSDWPGKRPDDRAVVYVALTGDGFSEAVALTLVAEADNVLIRDLVWGRP